MPHSQPQTPKSSTAPTSAIDVLVTGGTGLIGRWLLARLSAEGRSVGAIVRGGEKRREVIAKFVDSHGGDSRRVTLFDGELGGEGPLISDVAALSEVRDVFHLAAAFSFGMKPAHAVRINVDGALRVAELARALPRLRRFVALGGYRATRLPPWFQDAPYPLSKALQEKLYNEYGAYEASKLHAHRAIGAFAHEHGLPLTSVHPSTVIGCSTTGETNQRAGSQTPSSDSGRDACLRWWVPRRPSCPSYVWTTWRTSWRASPTTKRRWGKTCACWTRTPPTFQSSFSTSPRTLASMRLSVC